MKNNRVLFRSIFILLFILLVLFIFYILGLSSRVGYLDNFQLNVDDTLKINNLSYSNILYTNDFGDITNYYALENYDYRIEDLEEYIITNSNIISNYSYNVKLNYYSKVFRNSDIYGVYVDTNYILDKYSFIKDINFGNYGSPFGVIVSDSILSSSIFDVHYKLKLKINMIFYSILLFVFLFIIFNIFFCINILKSIFLFLFDKRYLIFNFFRNLLFNSKYFFILYFSLLLIFIIIILIMNYYGSLEKETYIYNFNININKTMEYNGIDYRFSKHWITGETFYTFYKTNVYRDFDVLEYIYTNNIITNYIYDFRVKYYSKLFNIYIDTNDLIKKNNFIYYIDIPYYGFTTGNTLSSSKYLNKNTIIDNVKYTESVQYIFILKGLSFFIIFLLIFIINKLSYFKDYIFYIFTILSIAILFFLELYIYSPGYIYYGDNFEIISRGFRGIYRSGHPVFLQYLLSVLYNIFGFSFSYFFVIQLFLWYLGLFFIIISLYKKYNNTYLYFLIFISFIANIFFANIYQVKDVTSVNFLWLSLSLIIFYLSFNIKNRIFNTLIIFFISLLLILSLISRNTMIITIYPLGIFLTYCILKNLNLRIKFIYFFSSMSIFLFLLVIIFKFNHLIWYSHLERHDRDIYYYHIYKLQVLATTVLSDDPTLIPNSFYKPGKTFYDARNSYFNNRTFADVFSYDTEDNIFSKSINSYELRKLWLKSILKHPIAYIKHSLFFSKEILLNPSLIFKLNFNYYDKSFKIFSGYLEEYNLNIDSKKYYPNFTDKFRIHIINAIYFLLPDFHITLFIFLSIIILFSSFLFILKNKKKLHNELLWFSFSTSLSVLLTFIFVSIFSPVAIFRYIYIIVPISIISIISFLSFLFDNYIKDS